MTEEIKEKDGAEEITEPKIYTEEQVMALLQSESDKRVQQALKTQQKKFEKQLSLSSLDGVEREKAEKDARIAELEEKLRELDIANNKLEIESVLTARGLSAEFANIIHITDDIEESQNKIDVLDKLFKASVTAEVEKRLAATGTTVKKGVGSMGDITVEQIKKMGLRELQELKKTKPELYAKAFN